MNVLSWEVEHYGMILEDREIVLAGKYIRIKVYSYENKLYISVMYNGHKLLFHELFD